MRVDEITEQREQLDENLFTTILSALSKGLGKIPSASKIIDDILTKSPKGTSRADVIKNLTPDELAKIQ